MVFSSVVFLFYFLPAFFLLYYLLPWKNTVLLLASLLFYAWGEPRYLPLLLFVIVLNYGFGLIVGEGRSKRALLAIGLVANLGVLAYFKYFGFLCASLDTVLNSLRLPALAIPQIALPLGISFFTFQGMSYLIDVYRGDVAAQPSLLKYAMYKAMFPQLVAGPIVRYAQVAHEVDHRSIDAARVEKGVTLFIVGLAQKVLIANTVAAPVDKIFALPTAELAPEVAWFGALGYALQIYFDFCGYSNMAIGMGHMMGFTFPRNFDRPYASQSVTEFWRRWHMTLSSWFRDYLYIPLGGNRRGPLKTYFNLLAVFFLCGLWHGASWTFVIWGLYHGAFLVVERLGIGGMLAKLHPLLRHAYLILVVIIGWVFFRSDTLGHAISYLHAMVANGGDRDLAPIVRFVVPSTILAVAAGCLLAVTPLPDLQRPTKEWTPGWRPATSAFCLAMLALSAVSLAAGTYNPFIYFRF